MGQTPQLDSMRQDAELAAITGNSPTATKQDKQDSIYASAKYMIAKRQYLKEHPQDKPAAPATPTTPSNKKPAAKVPSYKKGGKIRKTGLALVHKGERMIPKGKVARVEKVMKAQKRG